MNNTLIQPTEAQPKTRAKKPGYSFLQIFRLGSIVVLLLFAAAQCIFFPTLLNMFAVGIVIVVWSIVLLFFLRKDVLEKYPLSAYLIIGFGSTQYLFAMFFTLLEQKPLTFNLLMPREVFLHALLSFLVVAAAHMVYRLIYRDPGRRGYSFLQQAGLFKAPANLQLWIMGFVGLGATFYSYLYSQNTGGGWEATGSALDKFIQALIPFSYAPFFIPFGKLYGGKAKISRGEGLLYIIFILILFAVSIGRNSRGGFMMGFSSVAFCYLLGLLLGVFNQHIFTVKNGIIILAIGLFVTGPISDLGTAMVIVRDQRKDVKSSALISKTIDAYWDKEAIKSRRAADNKAQDDWDERYLNNILTARFSNLKFADASLYQATYVGNANKEFRKFTTDYFLASLPQPLLDRFKLDVDKKFVKSVSVGDYLYYSAGANEETLGGFRTGHYAGTGMAAFGWWYLLILGFGMMAIFVLIDKFYLKRESLTEPGKYKFRISMCAMLILDPIFRYLPVESVSYIGLFLIRDWIQLVVLYIIIFHISYYISLFFSNKQNANILKSSPGNRTVKSY